MVQGAVGIGLNLVCAPLLVLINPSYVPGPLIAAATLLTILIAWRDRAHIRRADLLPSVIGRVPAVIIGAAIVAYATTRTLSIIFAVMVLLAVAISLVGRRFHPTPKTLMSVGALSGLMATISSIGGPPVALAYQHVDAVEARATMSAFFTIGATFSVLTLAAFGEFELKDLLLAGTAVPGILTGFLLSKHLAKHTDKGLLRPIVLAISAGSAAVVLISNIS